MASSGGNKPDRNEPPKWSWRKHARGIGLVLLGVVLGFLGHRFLWPGAGGFGGVADGASDRRPIPMEQLVVAEERFKEEMRLAQAGFFRLVDFRRFAELGADLSLVLVASPNATREEVLASATGGEIRLPRIVLDPQVRQQWAELGQRLAGLQGGVDPRVFEAFQSIREFATANPLPNAENLGAVARSAWGRSAEVDRWVALNRNLASRVVAVLAERSSGS